MLTLKDDDVDENAEYIMDRYQTLGDSNFKRKFLDNITGSMEENLVASIQSNMVRKHVLILTLEQNHV